MTREQFDALERMINEKIRFSLLAHDRPLESTLIGHHASRVAETTAQAAKLLID